MTVLDPPSSFLPVAAAPAPAPARHAAHVAAPSPEPRPRQEPFGTLPPLTYIDTRGPLTWRHLPVRSLLSIFVAAAAGSGLILTALTASIKDRLRDAELPVVALQPSAQHERDGRGDSLRPRSIAPEQERRSFAAPLSQSVGGQEVIRTARFERLSVRLATIADAGEPAPPTLLDDALRPGGVAPAGEEPVAAAAPGEDADVVVTRRPLDPEAVPDESAVTAGDSADDESGGGSAELSAEVAAQEVRAFENGEVMRFAWLARRSVGLGDASGEAAAPAEDDAFSRLSIRFIPENVTVIDRRQRPAPVVTRVVLDGARPPADLLAERGLSRDEADRVASLLAVHGVQQGRTLALEAVAVAPGSSVHRIQRVAADVGGEMLPVVVRNDAGIFVGVDVPAAAPATPAVEDEEGDVDGVPLYLTLFRTAREAGL
jgi:hypothetical protein